MSDFLENKPVEITEEEAAVLGAELTDKVRKLVSLDEDIKKLQLKLAVLTDEYNDVSLKQLPELFAQKNVAEVKLNTGLVVGIEEKLFASVPKEDPVKRREALNWLAKHEGGDLIKKEIYFPWTEKEALALQERDVEYTIDEAVNANSLMAFLREKLGMKKNTVATMTLVEIPAALNPFLQKKAYVKK